MPPSSKDVIKKQKLIIDRIKALKSDGMSAPKIAETLNKEGLRTVTGVEFKSQNVTYLWNYGGGQANKKEPIKKTPDDTNNRDYIMDLIAHLETTIQTLKHALHK